MTKGERDLLAMARLARDFIALEEELRMRMDYELWMAERIVGLEHRLSQGRRRQA